MLDYIKITRPLNLLFVLLIQYTLFYCFLYPIIQNHDYDPILYGNHPIFLIIITIFVGAGGYIINDILDQNADLINKPDKTYIGLGHISKLSAWIYYGVVTAVGAVLTCYMMYELNYFHFWWLYPLIVVLLFMYSTHFKRTPLIGNIFVSFYSFMVPGIVFFAEWNNIKKLHGSTDYELIMVVMMAYLSFSFLATFLREIVKDLEDMEGDMQQGYHTLPISVGQPTTINFSLFIGLMLLMSYFLWFPMFAYHSFTFPFDEIFVLIIVLPTIYILIRLYYSENKQDYTILSRNIKIIMALSILIFLIFASTIV